MSSVKWQYVFVVFERKDNSYSYLYEFLSTLKKMEKEGTKDSSVHLLHHYEDEPNCKIITYYGGALNIVTKAFTPFHGEEVGNFIKNCKSLVPSPIYSGFVLYCHGNGWFYRHNEKRQAFSNLLVGFKKYKWDIFLLESCYCSTLEIAYEVKDVVHYLVTSECSRSSFPTFNSSSFALCDKCDPKQMAYHLADLYIKRCNMIPLEDQLILPPVGDIVVIDCTKIDPYLKFLATQSINNLPLNSYKNAKLKPNKKDWNRNYDVYTALASVLGGNDLVAFRGLQDSLVVYYRQTEQLKSKRYSKRFNGIAWCPVPWDSKSGWTYKYMTCYAISPTLLYKGEILSDLREEDI